MSELSSDPLERYEQIRNDPWLFLSHCVWTRDQADEANPIKPYPKDLDYLRFIVLMWKQHKMLAIPKSRRMTISWTMIPLALWDCIFHKGRDWAFVSKKEEDSKELVERAEFVFDHIPKNVISPDLLPKLKRGEMQRSPPALEFPDLYSKIQGFPSGGNQLRQRGFSGIFQDECSFWEEAQKAYASSKPTTDGGGRLIMVSSRATEDAGFFKRIVYDQLDAPSIRFPEIPPVKPMSPMEGIQVWKNPKNKFAVIELHYTANPAKRGEEFRQALKDTLPVKEYKMEYEKSWEAYAGKPVYEDFSDVFHVTHTKPSVHMGLPLLIGWDSSGLTPAAVLAQLQGETLVVIREIIGEGMGATRFVPHVAAQIAEHYPQIRDISTQTVSFFDPAGFRKNEITEETYLQHMIKGGFKQVRPGPMKWKARVESVTEWLLGARKGKAKFQVYEPDAPVLTAGLRGGFRYPEKQIEVESDKPAAIKDAHSHPNDALQYLCGGLKSYAAENYNIDLSAPSYGFQHHRGQKKELKYGQNDR